ncbi:helix-turn-helix domain-containing protein [Hafnia paralvei]|uniref:IprA winged helix-turn-helix domain-containing protein n=1 Tax=Hafnia paralvei TaxID=546367 RepID=A0A4Q9EFW2_9GAMM|nr:helix-turn-helix domain-containing protein [Hafnia paralvei]TBM21019.1 hypothetical protein EYY89_21780 [Hafnia paralvei]
MSNNIVNLTRPKEKPLSSLKQLFSLLIPHSVPFYPQSKQFSFHKKSEELQVLLLIKGRIEIYTHSCQILFVDIDAPAILGMQGSELLYEAYQFQIGRKSDETIMRTVPLSRCIEILTQSHGLSAMLDYQRYIRDYQLYRNTILACKKTQDIVCALLNEISEFPPEKRVKINVANYIGERSTLARSGIMKVLALMKEENYIQTEKGKLVKILKQFPA